MSLLFPDRAVAFEVRVALVKGLPELVGLKVLPVAPESPTPISAHLLRRMPLRELKAAALSAASGDDPFVPFKGRPGRGPHPLPPEHFERVAQLYRAAVAEGRPPLRAIADAYSVSRAGASKYVRQARALGLLGYPQRPGIAGASESESPFKERTA